MEQEEKKLPPDVPPYRWFIAMLADGTYRFVTPWGLDDAEKYIGQHGGAVYTHAGFMVSAANTRWWHWMNDKYDKQYGSLPINERPPHINVSEIECTFSQSAIEWLKENEDLLKEAGGKYYENLPRIRGRHPFNGGIEHEIGNDE